MGVDGGWPRRTAVSLGPVASDVPEAVDRRQVGGPPLRVADTETLLRCQAQYPHLALMQVAVHVERGLPGLGQRVAARQGGVDQALGDQPVRLPGLPVVGEVRADDALEVHPEVAVVVLVPEAAGG